MPPNRDEPDGPANAAASWFHREPALSAMLGCVGVGGHLGARSFRTIQSPARVEKMRMRAEAMARRPRGRYEKLIRP